MTEAEWLACGDPREMIRWLTAERHDSTCRPVGRRPVAGSDFQASERKLRLFANACLELCTCNSEPAPRWDADRWAHVPEPFESDHCPCTFAARAALLRDIFGDPFRPPVISGTDLFRWRSWQDGVVPRLARAAYEERVGRKCEHCDGTGAVERWDSGVMNRFGLRPWDGCPVCGTGEERSNGAGREHRGTGRIEDGALDHERLLVLADALEEAGCPTVEECQADDGWGVTDRRPNPIIAHLRSPGPHVRGCWVLDLLLGEE